MADNPEPIINGWRKCGLLKGFDEATKDEMLQMAKAATSTPGARHFPLFPAGQEVPKQCEPEPVTTDVPLAEEEMCFDVLESVTCPIECEEVQAAEQAAAAATARATAPERAKRQWADIFSRKV